ncbi:hypothetical protein Ciccas_003931 [Cichlidogyrus casuarinus]|uniref:Uncharacterized protein n=1 Tax=Cichlidogyrus casuarinus TaxID=1844966 RepID=A0ABD2QCY5_9PLAT
MRDYSHEKEKCVKGFAPSASLDDELMDYSNSDKESQSSKEIPKPRRNKSQSVGKASKYKPKNNQTANGSELPPPPDDREFSSPLSESSSNIYGNSKHSSTFNHLLNQFSNDPGQLNESQLAQFVQLQQQASHLQKYQQLQLYQQLLAASSANFPANPIAPSYLSGFATVGRPNNRPVNNGFAGQPASNLVDVLAQQNPLMNTAAAQQQLINHLGLINSTAALQQQLLNGNKTLSNSNTALQQSQCVYENSYNSFQRVPKLQAQMSAPANVQTELLSGTDSSGQAGETKTSKLRNGVYSTESELNTSGNMTNELYAQHRLPLSPAPPPRRSLETTDNDYAAASALLTAAADPTYAYAPFLQGPYGTRIPGLTGLESVTSFNPNVAASQQLLATAQTTGTRNRKSASRYSRDESSPKGFFHCSWHLWLLLIGLLSFLVALGFAVFYSSAFLGQCKITFARILETISLKYLQC